MALLFLSYRRVDASGQAGRLFDRLEAAFGRGEVYMDRQSGEAGDLWRDRLVREVEECRALVALVGREWMASFRAREGQPDYVLFELAHALRAGRPIFPVLIDGAEPPSSAELPPELQPFSERHAIPLHDDHRETYGIGVERLVQALSNDPGVRGRRLRMAAEALAAGRYELAAGLLERFAASPELEADASAYLALARAAGRPFNALKPQALAWIARDLQRALVAPAPPSLALATTAAFILDYFDLHGRQHPFGLEVEELEARLARATLAPSDLALLRGLRLSAPTRARLAKTLAGLEI